MCSKNIIKEKYITIMYYFLIVGVLFVFWTRISPMMVADADDWSYISYSRQAVPIWHAWNPAKVLPETITGLCGYFAAYIIYPVCGDYVMSMTYVFAFLTTALTLVYIYEFSKLIRSVFSMDRYAELFVGIVFLGIHFLLLNSLDNDNRYLLMSERLVCVTNYLWPMLFCACISMRILSERFTNHNNSDLAEKGNYIGVCETPKGNYKIGGVLLLIYLAVFSNIVTNIVLVALAGVLIAYDFISSVCSKNFKLYEYVKKHLMLIAVLFFDCIALFFEYNGGRADAASTNLGQTLEDLVKVFHLMNKTCVTIMAVCMLISFLLALFYKDRSYINFIFILWLSFIVLAAYLFILLVKVGDHKFLYTDNLIVLFFYFDLIFGCSLAYVISKCDRLKILNPLALYIFVFMILNVSSYGGNDFNSGGHLYRSICSGYPNYHECYEDGTSIVKQFVEADKQGKEEMDLYVTSYNLSVFNGSGDRISMTLFRHGVISKNIKVNVYLKE